MKSKRYGVLLVLTLLALLFGCTEYRYSHEISKTGESTLTLSIDYTSTLEEEAEQEGKTMDNKISEFKEGKEEKCMELMNESEGITCVVNEAVVKISKNLEPGEYYTFTKENNIPDHLYIVEINKIPSLDLIDNTLSREEYNLGELPENDLLKIYAAEEIGMVVEYTIVMPGKEIYEAYCGELEAEISGNSATFDLLEVGKQQSPMIVKSKEVDELYVNLVTGLAIIVFLILMYLMFVKRSRKK